MCWESNIPPTVNKKLQEAQKKGRYLDPLRCGEWEFEVVDENRQFVVKLNERTCDYGIWAVSGLPCKHAMACITKKMDDVEEYVHHYLKKPAYLRTYANVIHALPDENSWPNVQYKTVLPPIIKRKASRPRLSRRRGATEQARVQRSVGSRCSKCQQTRHNSRTCKENEPVAGQRKRYQAASSSSFSATGRTQTIGHLTTGASNSSTAVMRTTTVGHIPPTRVPNYAPPGRITRVIPNL
ncbi:hypothetical protein LWI29_015777 [Acer saccharum]|uniref:SWIM-type domain-containing protein n=1 Tax=Acer saccharum TaxID=4024 RepID=A0AA39T7G1_ACESA|nr:hypothetical protein LWI29_015777 [Acer saccharum]